MDFLPFTKPHIDEATIASVAEVLRCGWITSGPKVQAFEAALSAYFGGRTVRTFANGTATMEIALRLANIGPGDEVITTPISWVATANVIHAVGATAVFADIDPATRNLDLNAVEAAITPCTRALLPVDLAGLPVDRTRLYDIAARHELRVIEDAAQSFGSTWQGQKIGSFGDFVSFSFQANKNLTTAEGGCLVLPEARYAPLAEQLRLQGVVRTGFDGMEVEIAGSKANLTDINAAIGLGQLPHIETVTNRRRALARLYLEQFAQLQLGATGTQLPPHSDTDFAHSNWHMFQLVLPPEVPRAAFMERMKAVGIGIGVHYPPIHLFKLYRARGFRPGQFPHAERVGAAIVSLPLFGTLRDEDVLRVCENTVSIITALQHA